MKKIAIILYIIFSISIYSQEDFSFISKYGEYQHFRFYPKDILQMAVAGTFVKTNHQRVYDAFELYSKTDDLFTKLAISNHIVNGFDRDFYTIVFEDFRPLMKYNYLFPEIKIYQEDFTNWVLERLSDKKLYEDMFSIYEKYPSFNWDSVKDTNKRPKFYHNGKLVNPVYGEKSLKYTVKYENKEYTLECINTNIGILKDKDADRNNNYSYIDYSYYILINNKSYPEGEIAIRRSYINEYGYEKYYYGDERKENDDEDNKEE